ncbi:MAG: glycosyltransferase family 2 protein [Candidatus Saccharibacteria bacterium]|nr:glycosyltransferase family 2 protein [Candidatus Saccharibacteria bacterium]
MPLKKPDSIKSDKPEELVSIIVPIYNVEAYLLRCLKSLAAQTYKTIEVILIDDASTDKSGAICDDFVSKDDRFQVMHSRENLGPARTRNVAIHRAHGKYFVFVDGDDYVKPTFVEKLHKAINDSKADISVCGYVSDKLKHAAPEGIMSGFDACIRLLTQQHNSDVVIWNKMYRAELFKDISFIDAKTYEANLTTYRYYAAAKKIAFINNALYFYTVRKDSLTAQTTTYELLSARLKAAREAQKYFTRKDFNRNLRDAACFSEVLAEFGFIDKSLSGEIASKYYAVHRSRALKHARHLYKNRYVTTRVKFYFTMLRLFGGFPYKFFRNYLS